MFMRQLTSQIAYAKTSENKLPIELFVLLEDLSASFDHKVGNGWFFLGGIISTQTEKFRIKIHSL